MAIEQEIQSALGSGHPTLALRTLVIDLHEGGVSKEGIHHKLYWYSQFPSISESEQDALFDVLDTLAGFCSPEARLIPKEPDIV